MSFGSPPHVRPKINIANAANFRGAFKVQVSTQLPPRIHHHLPRKTPCSAHPISQKPLEKRAITAQKKIPRGNYLKPANKQFAFIDHLRRKMIVKQDKELLMPHHLLLPLVTINRLELVEDGARKLQPLPINVLKVRRPADRVSLPIARPRTRSTTHL